jgi:hypothetical protein
MIGRTVFGILTIIAVAGPAFAVFAEGGPGADGSGGDRDRGVGELGNETRRDWDGGFAIHVHEATPNLSFNDGTHLNDDYVGSSTSSSHWDLEKQHVTGHGNTALHTKDEDGTPVNESRSFNVNQVGGVDLVDGPGVTISGNGLREDSGNFQAGKR